jgi:hypothetical protein
MKTKTKVFRFWGGFLIFAACAMAFLWFYWLAPWRNLHNSSWLLNHTHRRAWLEVQRQLRRTGPDHDSSIAIGYCGDKNWTEWVLRQLRSRQPQEEILSCGEWPFHLPDALCDMTNQSPTNWFTWWETNKLKSQVEWVRDGFARAGIPLQQPLTTNNTVALLSLIASSSNSVAISNVPPSERGGLRYNACRWLRDSHFDFREFDLSSVPPEVRDAATRGLLAYAHWLLDHWDDPGNLPVSGSETDPSRFLPATAAVASASFTWFVSLALLALAFSGVLLLRLATKSKAHSVRQTELV